MKRFSLHGSDNSLTSFMVQLPCHRQCRREERVIQIFRTFNWCAHLPCYANFYLPLCSALSRHKESRKRNLFFHLPAAVACSPSVRLYQTDSSYISLGEIYDLHCEETGIPREEPILFVGEKIRKVLREYRHQTGKTQVCSPLRPFSQSFSYIT